jgi:hypothetical protein
MRIEGIRALAQLVLGAAVVTPSAQAAPQTATRLANLDATTLQTMWPGIPNHIRFATEDDFAQRVPFQDVIVYKNCIGELRTVDTVTSDAAGKIDWVLETGSSRYCQVSTYLAWNGDGLMLFYLTAPAPTVLSSTGPSPTGLPITFSLGSATVSCSLSSSGFYKEHSAGIPLPSGVAIPQGVITFKASNCGAGQPVGVDIDFAQALPPTAQWWQYGGTPGEPTPHWYPMAATVDGNRISFSVTDGARGDDDVAMNGIISLMGMVVVPGGMFQDLWWSGASENGWGMSLVQHGDALFANVFAYDAQGVATWYVMPSGSWNAAHTAYTGNLYLPKGSAFYAYDARRFDAGASVGTMKLTFASPNEATFDYTINGVTGRKSISRILFGPHDAPTDKSLADLWWAGVAQNGWGVAVLQQYSTLFALWYTYDANGKATWFVMPGGSWAAKDDYRGRIYRPEGPPWLGVPYDVSRHHTTDVGDFRVRFGSDGATFDYTVDGRTGSIPLSRIPF